LNLKAAKRDGGTKRGPRCCQSTKEEFGSERQMFEELLRNVREAGAFCAVSGGFAADCIALFFRARRPCHLRVSFRRRFEADAQARSGSLRRRPSVRIDGRVRPLSSRATTGCVVPIFLASCACVRPARFQTSITAEARTNSSSRARKPSVLRLFHPLLVHVGYACHCLDRPTPTRYTKNGIYWTRSGARNGVLKRGPFTTTCGTGAPSGRSGWKGRRGAYAMPCFINIFRRGAAAAAGRYTQRERGDLTVYVLLNCGKELKVT